VSTRRNFGSSLKNEQSTNGFADQNHITAFRNGGIETIGQLWITPRKELISMRNMGTGKSIGSNRRKIKRKGISLQVLNLKSRSQSKEA